MNSAAWAPLNPPLKKMNYTQLYFDGTGRSGFKKTTQTTYSILILYYYILF